MKKNVIRLLFLLAIMTLGTAATAHAQLMPGDPDDPMNQVFYQDPGDPDTSGGGVFYYCAAKARWGGYCRTCVQRNGQNICGDVSYAARCTCDIGCTNYRGVCSYER